MTDSVPSDHPSVSSHRVHLSSVGHTSRTQVVLPEDCEATADDVVSLSLSGDNYHSQITTTLAGERVIRGAFTNRRLAREGEDSRAENALLAWVGETGLEAGDALVFDVLTAGYAYGLRQPGERVVYRPPDAPDSSLADIARSLEDDSDDSL